MGEKSNKTPAQLRKRESDLLGELCQAHGYSLADTLPDRDRSTMLMSRKSGKTELHLGIVCKLMVPAQSSLGRKLVLMRAEKRKPKAAK